MRASFRITRSLLSIAIALLSNVVHSFPFTSKLNHIKHNIGIYQEDATIPACQSKLFMSNDKYSMLSHYGVDLSSIDLNITKGIHTNNINSDVKSLAPAFEITYFYLQKTLNLTEETMWKITINHGSILGLTVPNIKAKLTFLKRALKLSNNDMRAVISRLPAILSLTPKNIQLKITFLRQTLGIRTLELKHIVLRYPSILTYSISNTNLKIHFFTDYLKCTNVQTRKLIIDHPEVITYSTMNVHSKVNFLLNQFIGSSIQNADNKDIDIIRRVILSNPIVLGYSLEKNLYPKMVFWREMLQIKAISSKHLLSVITKFPQFLNYNVQQIQLIFDYFVNDVGCSVLEFRIMLLKCPRIITHSLKKIKGFVEYLMYDLQIDQDTQLKRVLLHAPQLISVSNESLRAKVQYLRSLITQNNDYNKGHDEILRKIIVGMPTLLSCSIENNLQPKIDYFLEVLNGNEDKLIEMITVQPTLLGYSLQKRIKPRMKQILDINEDPRRITVAITLSNDKFDDWILQLKERGNVSKRGRKRVTTERYFKKNVDKGSSPNDEGPLSEEEDENKDEKRIIVWTRPRKWLQ